MYRSPLQLLVLLAFASTSGCDEVDPVEPDFVSACRGSGEPRKEGWSRCADGLVLACVDRQLVEETCAQDLARRFPDREPSPEGLDDLLYACVEGNAACTRRREFCRDNARVSAFLFEDAVRAGEASVDAAPPASTVLEACGEELTCIERDDLSECFDCTPHCEMDDLVLGCASGEPIYQDCRAQGLRCVEEESGAGCQAVDS